MLGWLRGEIAVWIGYNRGQKLKEMRSRDCPRDIQILSRVDVNFTVHIEQRTYEYSDLLSVTFKDLLVDNNSLIGVSNVLGRFNTQWLSFQGLNFLFWSGVVLWFHPAFLVHDFRREKPAENPETRTTDKQPNPICEVIKPDHPDGCTDAHIIQKAVKIRNNSQNVAQVSSNIPTIRIIICPLRGRDI